MQKSKLKMQNGSTLSTMLKTGSLTIRFDTSTKLSAGKLTTSLSNVEGQIQITKISMTKTKLLK